MTTVFHRLRLIWLLLAGLLCATTGGFAAIRDYDSVESELLAAKSAPVAAKTTAGTTGYRYVTEAEIQAIKDTGLLRGGRPGETFFTKDVYKSGAHAQERLSLPNMPTHRVEFNITNNPAMLRNGTKVDPVGSLPGKGSEFMTTDPVRVDLINVQPLR